MAAVSIDDGRKSIENESQIIQPAIAAVYCDSSSLGITTDVQ